MKNTVGGRISARRRRPADDKDDLTRIATVTIDGQVLPLHSWSMAGFRCGGYKGLRRPGQTTGVRIIIPSSDGPQSFALTAEVTGRDFNTGALSAKFIHIPERQIDRINAVFARVLSGRR